MLFLTAAQTDISTLELGLGEICLRLLCAMVVGMVIGTEREYTNRPAGMRTHILVALGACAVMITGQMLFQQYSALGAAPDPGRLGAQVITGVGFLGAGTILREGSNVKGLTTAASLWAVACLGLAAGGGYYTIALTGMVFIFITLTLLEVFQHKLVRSAGGKTYYVTMTNLSAGLKTINKHAASCQAVISRMAAETTADGYHIHFYAEFGGVKGRKRQERFYERLNLAPEIICVTMEEDGAPV